jgi:hypothetical protein
LTIAPPRCAWMYGVPMVRSAAAGDAAHASTVAVMPTPATHRVHALPTAPMLSAPSRMRR